MIKLKLPTKIEATYKIVTPMFIGDSEQNATGISPQSFKGALRFWWRALAWSRIFSENNNEVTALKELHKQESMLFGTSNSDNGGKGCVAIKIPKFNFKTKKRNQTHPKLTGTHNSIRYLAYGVADHRGMLTRDSINENQEFKVIIIVDNTKKIEEIKKALIAIGLLGSLGSKARKGLGSIVLKSLNYKCNKEIYKWKPSLSIEEYIKSIETLFKSKTLAPSIPPFSAFTKHSTITQLIPAKNDCFSVLSNYATSMMMYRSWGRNGLVLGRQSLKKFRNDHDWSKGILQMPYSVNTFHPQRVVFGLPHNYGKIQVGRSLENDKYGRRSSPLFFHVHQVGKEFIGLAILLKATFLPVNEAILANGKKINQKIEWDVIEKEFLENSEYFPDAKQIKNYSI